MKTKRCHNGPSCILNPKLELSLQLKRTQIPVSALSASFHSALAVKCLEISFLGHFYIDYKDLIPRISQSDIRKISKGSVREAGPDPRDTWVR